MYRAVAEETLLKLHREKRKSEVPNLWKATRVVSNQWTGHYTGTILDWPLNPNLTTKINLQCNLAISRIKLTREYSDACLRSKMVVLLAGRGISGLNIN